MSRSLLVYFSVLFPLVLDYRGVEEGGGVFQFLIYGLTVFSIFCYLAFAGRVAFDRKFRFLIFVFFVYVIFSIVVPVFKGVPLDNFVRVFGTIILLPLGVIWGYKIYSLGDRAVLQDVLVFSLVVSVVFSAVYGFVTSGLGLLEIRFQILSPVILFAVFIPVYKGLWGQKLSYVESLLLVLSLALIFISMTRGLMLAVLLIVFGVYYLVSQFRKFDINKLIVYLAVFVGVSAVFVFYVPDEFYERMYQRVFGSYKEFGYDVTTLSRLAEIEYQLDVWSDNLSNIVFGLGFGAPYSFSERYFDDLSMVTPIGEIMDIEWWAVGHNFWVYSLFSHGLLMGWFLPLLFLCVSVSGVFQFKMSSSNEYMGDKYWLGWGVISALSFILTTIGGNPLGPRYSCLLYGIGVGVFFAASAKVIRNKTKSYGVDHGR